MNNIPFSDRVINLPNGFALIWPFRNLTKSIGPYELVLDNNALITSHWFNQLSISIKKHAFISPFHAIAEQWVSNPEFKNKAANRIDKFIQPFIQSGAIFSENFSKDISSLLIKNDNELRTQWMITYLYVVLLYRLVSSRKEDLIPKQLLSSLKNIDVPRFNACVMLCTLADYLKENKNLKLNGDTVPAFSYISSFVNLHTSAKNENSVDVNYLRNRAGDLSIWLCIPYLKQMNYQAAGDLVVVTQDKALKNLIFRCLPCVGLADGRMSFSFDERSFESSHSQKIIEKIQSNICIPNPTTNKDAQLKKLFNLKEHVTKDADTKLISEVNKVWNEWITPGFHGKFTL